MNMVLKILGAHLHDIEDPALTERYEQVTKCLAMAGWAYPYGTAHCRMMELPTEVRAMTEDLIDLWKAAALQPVARR